MQLNDIVNFTENGKEYKATVLAIRNLDHHDGENGEPLLHLGYFATVLDAQGDPKNLVGTQAQNELVQFRLDVAHSSHTFSEEANRKGFKGVYPGGRWTELDAGQPAEVVVTDEKSKELGDGSEEDEPVIQ